jgi:magnesium-protoporphyrin O-methyltransferase
MPTETYQTRRGELTEYFDQTAVDAWAQMTSDAPLSKVRETVRAGREQMRATLLDMLPGDLAGARLLDAGCGTGAFAYEAARRGAEVVAIDLSPNLIALARSRHNDDELRGSIAYLSGDMLDAGLGKFDYLVAMDSFIHYQAEDVARMLSAFAPRIEKAMAFTFAPETTALRLMHTAGKLFPRSDRSPAIEPIRLTRLQKLIGLAPALADWSVGETQRISQGFYTSQAMELKRA